MPKFRAHINKVAAALRLLLQALGMFESLIWGGTAQEFCCSMAAACLGTPSVAAAADEEQNSRQWLNAVSSIAVCLCA